MVLVLSMEWKMEPCDFSICCETGSMGLFSLTCWENRFVTRYAERRALSRDNYLRIVENRSKFGYFDLLFGAAALNLKIRDQPVHYRERTYGETNISRFRHDWLLLRMSWVAAKKIKFI